MTENKLFLSLFLIMSYMLTYAQQNIHLSGNIESRMLIKENRLPFWTYTNTNSFLSSSSNYGINAFAKASYEISGKHTIETGLGAFVSDGTDANLRRSQVYIDYKNSWFRLLAGSKIQEDSYSGLSTINNNILMTGNARPLTGVLIENTSPIHIFKNFLMSGAIAHYALNDNRSTEEARVHYKMIHFNWLINQKNSFSFGLKHYVQWGGVLEDGTRLPDDFNAFVRIFTGSSGGDIDNYNESVNALGNHLGSYTADYKIEFNDDVLNFYHQSIFEDRSGRELNNFPDGVWGLYYAFDKKKLVNAVLYEYIQTISQSGRPVVKESGAEQSGGDNYFLNGIYPSGWTYEGRIIGLPLINPFGNQTTPSNNRTIAHHFGIKGYLNSFIYKLKGTYVQNLGTYNNPINPRQQGLYTFAEVIYPTKEFGTFTLYSGIDYLNDFEHAATIGIGYSYKIN